MAAVAVTTNRTSSWPVRNQRMHEAALALHYDVVKQLSEISIRLSGIEDRISRLEAHTDAKFDNYDPGNTTARLDRLEILLFRTHVEDFGPIDEEMKKLLPQTQDVATLYQEAEPEQEASPLKPSSSAENPSGHLAPTKCALFDISSDVSAEDANNAMPWFAENHGTYRALMEIV